MRWGTAVVGLLLTAVMLFGCTDKPEEGGTPPPLASASPTPSASPSPKHAGADIDQITALSKDYFSETNRAVNTGDTKRLRSLFTPECSSCLKVAAYIEEHWKSGSIRAPDYYKVSQVSGATVSSPTTGFANVVYTLGKETRLDSSGRPTKINPPNPKPQAVSVSLVKLNSVWKVAGLVKQG